MTPDPVTPQGSAEPGTAALTEGDLVKALHDVRSVLGYWPDPARIDGRWEMWGAALLAALTEPAARAEPLPGLPEIDFDQVLDDYGTLNTYTFDSKYPGWADNPAFAARLRMAVEQRAARLAAATPEAEGGTISSRGTGTKPLAK